MLLLKPPATATIASSVRGYVTPVQRPYKKLPCPSYTEPGYTDRCATRAFVATIYASIVVPPHRGSELRLTRKRRLDLTALASQSFLAAFQQQVSWTRSVFVA